MKKIAFYILERGSNSVVAIDNNRNVTSNATVESISSKVNNINGEYKENVVNETTSEREVMISKLRSSNKSNNK